MGRFNKVTLQVQSKEDPETWNTVNAYKHENALVESGDWTHKRLLEHAHVQMGMWIRNSHQFDGRKIRVYVDEENQSSKRAVRR